MAVLTRRRLNRAVLARQSLLGHAQVPLPRGLEMVAGIQAQYAPSIYVGLWSRLAGLARDDVTAALEDRSAVQATLMRQTIHVVSREDFWPFALATRDARRANWLRATPHAPPEEEMVAAAAAVVECLRSGPTLRRRDLDRMLGRPVSGGVGNWVDLVRVPPSGTWDRRRADVFGLAESWVGRPDVDVGAARFQLVQRYLRAFGPASRKDVASFTGLGLRDVDAALAASELDQHTGPDGDVLHDVPGSPLPEEDTPAPVRFLPTWDAILLVHARRSGVLPEEYRPRLFSTKTPQSFPTFLVDGAVAGTWSFADAAVRLEPFARVDRGARAALDAEADRLASFAFPSKPS